MAKEMPIWTGVYFGLVSLAALGACVFLLITAVFFPEQWLAWGGFPPDAPMATSVLWRLFAAITVPALCWFVALAPVGLSYI